tara:strand:+ start:9307 stop:9948 length:642 start_codon:yes stop_codon:yes gene_type:complete
MIYKTIFLFLAVTTAQTTNNLLDTFVSTFTFTNIDEAKDLVDVLQKCDTGVTSGDFLFQEILRDGINATRVCSTEISRDTAHRCVDHFHTIATLTTSPFNVLAIEKLSTSDITALNTCGNGLDTTATSDILAAVLVILKRYVVCDLNANDLTSAQQTAITDIFTGTEQVREVNRALLANVCNSLHFAGTAHKDVVDFITQTMKTYIAFYPQRG